MEISFPAVQAAHNFIRPHIRRTPLIRSGFLSELAAADVWLKLENFQPTGSFKVRGALNKIGSLTGEERKRGIVAASAGNHALGIGYAVNTLGDIQTDIFVPQSAPRAKLEKLRRFPVNMRLVGQTFAEAHQAAEAFRLQTGAVEVSAYDDTAVIIGQATIALEIFQDLPQADILLVPTGGGGILAGIGRVAQAITSNCKIVGLQPDASPAALLSFQQGRAIDPFDHKPTIADGLAGGFGRTPFALLQVDPPEILLATEEEIRRSIYTLVEQHQLIIEPSGAIAIAPLLGGDLNIAGQTVVCVLTGGNLDTRLLRKILNEFEDR